MDSFDRQILAVLENGKPRDFQQLLREAGFSHNTLKMRLVGLERQGFILKAEKRRESPGRPGFTYSLNCRGIAHSKVELRSCARALM